jgi:hypothetical protein
MILLYILRTSILTNLYVFPVSILLENSEKTVHLGFNYPL